MNSTTTSASPASALTDGAALRGLLRLGFDGVLGITGLVEAMHHNITSLAGIVGPEPAGRPRGITGFVYRAVQGTTRGVGAGLDGLLAALPLQARHNSREWEALRAALNGVWGDHLEDTANPLAIPMSLRIDGRPWREAPGEPSERLLVLVHGLAMNDLQWLRGEPGTAGAHDHGQALARELGSSALYLHYNSGRHISHNGRDFSKLLDELVEQWPLPVRELVIVAHSMGGLVTRSACHQGEGRPWRKALRRIVFLGTPHHGAPLERGGHLVDGLFGASPYIAPFARLGKTRSAGITDLRFGNLQDADWQHRCRHTQRHDDRVPTPLPAGVRCHLVAATRRDVTSGLRTRLIGDGLVPLASALGEHADAAHRLQVPARRRLVVTNTDHWGLLRSAEVYTRLREWLA